MNVKVYLDCQDLQDPREKTVIQDFLDQWVSRVLRVHLDPEVKRESQDPLIFLEDLEEGPLIPSWPEVMVMPRSLL